MPDVSDEVPEPVPDVVIRAGGHADLLALLAIRLGFHPDESLLVASLDERGRLGFSLRVDLPHDRDVDALVDSVVAVMQRQDARRVVVAAVGRAGRGLGRLVGTVADRFAQCAVDVDEAVVADGRRWWCQLCPGSSPESSAGTAYDLTSSAPMAQAVLAGVSVLPSRTALADGFAAVHGPRRAHVHAAVVEVRDDVHEQARRAGCSRPLHASPQVLTSGASRVRQVVEAFVQAQRRAEEGRVPAELDDRTIAELAVLTALVPVRDVAWSMMSRAQATRHAALWSCVARHVPTELSAAPLSLAGFASWLHGDGAAAWCAVERCLQEHPDYSMALLIAEALERAVPPDAWSPVPDDLLAAALHPPLELDDPAA